MNVLVLSTSSDEAASPSKALFWATSAKTTLNLAILFLGMGYLAKIAMVADDPTILSGSEIWACQGICLLLIALFGWVAWFQVLGSPWFKKRDDLTEARV